MHILIIEDDPSIVVDYRMVLDEIGYTSLTCFDNVKQAKVHLKNRIVDIVIADIYLGEQSGLDLLPEFKDKACNVIVITGFPLDTHVDIVIKHDVDRFLTKPIGLKTLKHELLRIIKLRNETITNSFLFHYSRNKIIRIPYSNILYFETEGNYTTLFKKGKKIVIKKSLRIISQDLPDHFQHVYRNIIVNSNYIQSIDYTKNTIELTSGEVLNLGNAYKRLIKEYMLNHYSII
jgi:two-component system, LytTR family, response regulator